MPFTKEPTRTTPYVNINHESGVFEIQGTSSPEHAMAFYDPVYQAIAEFSTHPSEKIEAHFRMIYFNTSSARCIFKIIKEFKDLADQGKEVVINWHFEEDDDDMEDTGRDFMDLIDMPFNFVAEEED